MQAQSNKLPKLTLVGVERRQKDMICMPCRMHRNDHCNGICTHKHTSNLWLLATRTTGEQHSILHRVIWFLFISLSARLCVYRHLRRSRTVRRTVEGKMLRNRSTGDKFTGRSTTTERETRKEWEYFASFSWWAFRASHFEINVQHCIQSMISRPKCFVRFQRK